MNSFIIFLEGIIWNDIFLSLKIKYYLWHTKIVFIYNCINVENYVRLYFDGAKIPLQYCLTYVSMSYNGVLYVGVGVDCRAADLPKICQIDPGHWTWSNIWHGTEFNMHHGTYAVNQTGLMWQTGLVSNLYFESVVQLTWIGLKYSIEHGSILYFDPGVLLA